MSVKVLKLFDKRAPRIDYYSKAPWSRTSEYGEIYFNIGNSKEDLLNHDGKTYSGEIREYEISGDYICFNVDSQQGWRYDYQVILKLKNEVKND